MPNISIVMPSFNRAQFIGQTIESVLKQTLSDWELIIVDDGSTDNTQEVVAGYQDQRIRYIWQANSGATAARNAGISIAQGKLIACIDSDDLMLPHNLQVLKATLDAHADAGCAYGWFYFMNEAGEPFPSQHGRIHGPIPAQIDQPWPGRMPPLSGTSDEGHILPELLSNTEGTLAMGAFLARREWVDLIGGFNPARRQHQEHWDFFIRLARAGCAFACCRQAVMLCREHSGGAHRQYRQMFNARLDVLEQIYKDSESDLKLKTQIEPVRVQAYYRTYVNAAKDCYSCGDLEAGATYLKVAEQYGQIDDTDLHDMASGAAKGILSHSCSDVAGAIHTAFATMSDSNQAQRVFRQTISLVDFNLAFRLYSEGHAQQALAYSVKAVTYDPHHIMNRGLIKIMLSSLVASLLLIIGFGAFLE